MEFSYEKKAKQKQKKRNGGKHHNPNIKVALEIKYVETLF